MPPVVEPAGYLPSPINQLAATVRALIQVPRSPALENLLALGNMAAMPETRE